MDVMDDGAADFAELAVDPGDLLLDVSAHLYVAFDAFAARGRQLHHDGVGGIDALLHEKFVERSEPDVDAFGVVEAVDAQHDVLGVSEFFANLLGAVSNCLGARELVELAGVDGDREGADADATETYLHHTEFGADADGST